MFGKLKDARRLAGMVNMEMPDFPHKPVILYEVCGCLGSLSE